MKTQLKRSLVRLCTIGLTLALLSCKNDDPCVVTVADAGEDQTVPGTTTTLQGNTPRYGTGVWTIVSGEDGQLVNPTDPLTSFSGKIGSLYTLRWTITSCSSSHDDVEIAFMASHPTLWTIDKNSVVNGEIITIAGLNFTANYNGASQINIMKTTDPFFGEEVFLPILSRNATEIKAVMVGANGGAVGEYALRYNMKPDAGPATLYASNLSISVRNAGQGEFYTSATFTNRNVSKGTTASFGIKNGSTTPGDYTIKLVNYNHQSGVATEYAAAATDVTLNGYDSMDKITFTVPADIPSGSYYVKISYGNKTLIGGWGFSLNIN
jgi:hypothetical protein